jgi:PPOX class probable F420-dependent enzyme
MIVRLPPADLAFLADARRGILATIAPDGLPRLVPFCFVVASVAAADGASRVVLWSPIDDKPKRTADPLALGRARDLVTRPQVTVLVDHWSEDWTQLAWLRCDGRGQIVSAGEAGHADAIAALRTKYPQYRRHALESRPLIRIDVERATIWRASAGS